MSLANERNGDENVFLFGEKEDRRTKSQKAEITKYLLFASESYVGASRVEILYNRGVILSAQCIVCSVAACVCVYIIQVAW